MASTVAVLFAHEQSYYKRLPNCDVWDKERDATQWPGGAPLIAHPPCRLWSRMRRFSKAPEEEKLLAMWAVGMVRRWGGVLEHPSSSLLWPTMGLPRPGKVDAHGGFTIGIPQYWWGHVALKPTWLYVSGCHRGAVPPVPYAMGTPPKIIATSNPAHIKRSGQTHATKNERILTPPDFAHWLVSLALLCQHAEEA